MFVATSERRLASGHCVSARLLPAHIRYMIWTITTSTFTEVLLQHRTFLKKGSSHIMSARTSGEGGSIPQNQLCPFMHIDLLLGGGAQWVYQGCIKKTSANYVKSGLFLLKITK